MDDDWRDQVVHFTPEAVEAERVAMGHGENGARISDREVFSALRRKAGLLTQADELLEQEREMEHSDDRQPRE